MFVSCEFNVYVFLTFVAINCHTKFLNGSYTNKACPNIKMDFKNIMCYVPCLRHQPRVRHIRETNTSGILTIPIGSIFNPGDLQCRSAFRLAATLFNQRTDKIFEIKVSLDPIDVSDSFKLATTICHQMSQGVFLFFGMSSIRSMDIVRSFCNRFHMPYISPSLSDVSVHMDPRGYQLHMKPPYTEALVDMIKHYRWRSVHYLYDSEEGLQRLQQIFRSEKSKHPIRFAFRRLEDVYNAHEDLKHLDQNAPELRKNIILDLSSHDAYVAIMKQIAEVGMNKYGYFYLLASMDFSRLDFRRFVHGGVNLTGFDILDSQNQHLINFTNEWNIANKNNYAGAGDSPLMSDAALAVDSLHLVVESLKNMMKQQPDIFQKNFRRGEMYNFNNKGIPCNKKEPKSPEPRPWKHGPALMYTLKTTEIDGLTGHVAFNDVGFRKDYTLHVSTVGLHQHPVKIGIWKPGIGYRGLSNDTDYDRIASSKSKIKIITTIMSPPFLVYNEEYVNGSGSRKYKGYAADLADRLAKIVDFEYELKLVSDGKYGSVNSTSPDGNETWNGMIGELIRGEAHLAIAPLTITYSREKVVDFTKPFMDVGISIMIKKPDIEKPGVFSFMEPLSWQIWVCILIGYGSVSIGLFLVSRFSPYEWRKVLAGKGFSYENDFSILNSFWFSTGALMLQGSDACPRSNSGRIIGTVWWFFVLIIISSYTANLAAFLTIERMVAPIESADDLAKQTEIRYGLLSSGTTEQFFKDSKVPTYERMWAFMSTSPGVIVDHTEDGITKVRESKGKYAFLLDSTVNDYTNSREPCDTLKVGRNLNAKGFGVATPQGSDLLDALNLAVLELKEDGTLHRLRQTWWQDKSQCSPDGKESGSKKRSLSLSNVAGVFYILIGGLVLAVILGALEFTFKRLRLVPKGAYMRATETEQSLLRTPSERENGGIGEYPAHFSPDYQPDKEVQTFTYGTSLQPIGFEALNDRNTHTDV